jgi:hypothetical protein
VHLDVDVLDPAVSPVRISMVRAASPQKELLAAIRQVFGAAMWQRWRV